MALARAASTASASRLPSREPCTWPSSADFVRASRRALDLVGVALLAQPLELGELLLVDAGVVDPEDVERVLVGEPVGVHADQLLRAGVEAGLRARGCLLDAHLRQPLLDRLGHAAVLLGLLDVRPGALGEVVGEPLDVVGPGPGVDRARRTATPAAAAAGCCARCARRSRSAARSPRRGRWCAATGCGPGSRPSPRCRCAARC